MEVFMLNKAHSEQRIKSKVMYLKTVPCEFLIFDEIHLKFFEEVK